MLDVNTMYDIPDYEGYRINREGKIFNIKTGNEVHTRYGAERRIVSLPEGSINTQNVASLVLLTFIGPFNGDIGFRDSNAQNCSLDNVFYKIEKIVQLTESVWTINGETFKRIPGFSNYLISTKGVVYSIKRGIFIALSFNHAGYATVTITDDTGFRSPRKVHRLVYITYIGEIDEDMVVDHVDDKKNHNQCTNLAQITNRDNVLKSYQSGSRIRGNAWGTTRVRQVCEMIEQNLPIDEIGARLGFETDLEFEALAKLIGRLLKQRGGPTYSAIANEYDLSNYAMSSVDRYTRKGALTSDNVAYIWTNPDNLTQTELSNKFNCAPGLISLIKTGKAWRNLTSKLENKQDKGSTTIERIA